MNIFLVHGSFGKPFENWFPWLEAELDKRNIKCVIPTFPTPEHQNYSDWEKLMDYYYSLGLVNSDTILIGHSCGSVFLVHYLLAHKIKVAGLITVSGYNNFYSGDSIMDSLNGSFYFDTPTTDLAPFVSKNFALFSDNDPNIPISVLEQFAELTNAEKVLVPNAGHFNAAAGFTKCDIVLSILENNFIETA